METLFFDPAREVLEKMVSFISLSLVALIIIGVGWVLAKSARGIISRILKAIKLDKLGESSGLSEYLRKGDIKYTISDLVAVIVYWLIMLIVIMITANVLGLTIVAELLDKIVLYIPNVLAAMIVLVIGSLFAVFLRRVVETTAENAGLSHSRGLGMLVHVIIVVFAVIIALEQLRIGITILSQFLTIILGSVGLALALAFGLGSKEIAGEAVRDLMEKTRNKK